MYDAWGNCKIIPVDNVIDVELCDEMQYNNIGFINPIRYRGYYFDIETKLYYLGSRYYDAELGRFINADAIDYLEPNEINGLNLYAYCGNNPVMGYDPNGTINWKKFWRTIGAIVLVVAAVAVFAVASIATGGLAGVALMSVAAGMAIGATVGGVSAILNGTDIAAGILGGAIKGGAIGFAFGVGIAAGAGALSLGVGLLAFGSAVAINFAAGMAKYAIDNSMNGKALSWKDAAASGGMQALSGIFAFGAGVIAGAAGFYNVSGAAKIFSAEWIKKAIGAQFVKAITYYPFNFIFSYLQKSFFSGEN